ncbi:membrane protein [Nocardia jinanensis]|uniref:Membrane protein n=2 Tax=Nocardia jinanensis TaxID=382504 RepID=A0A917VXC3_9NOCA|nr:membrane protein [Nocardia jinanensis]
MMSDSGYFGAVSVWGEIVVGLVILVGLVGIVVPILPGVILIFGAIAVWAFVTGGTTAWAVLAISTVLLVISGVVKYTWPGQKLKEAGVPNRTLLLGGIAGIAGFFVIPVVGLFVGFVVGVYLSELQRLPDNRQAWVSSKHAIKGVGLSILVELLGALLASGVWVIGAIAA